MVFVRDMFYIELCCTVKRYFSLIYLCCIIAALSQLVQTELKGEIKLSGYMRTAFLCFHRIYEHISDLCLFLFNDALVISRRHIFYTPFRHVPSTSYQFMASVSLPRLLVEDIPDTKCKFTHNKMLSL